MILYATSNNIKEYVVSNSILKKIKYLRRQWQENHATHLFFGTQQKKKKDSVVNYLAELYSKFETSRLDFYSKVFYSVEVSYKVAQ